MDRHCPLCSEDLYLGIRTRKVPLRGESRVLALRWYIECPYCKGALQRNVHPAENQIFRGLMLAPPAFTAMAWAFGFNAKLYWTGVALLPVAAFILYKKRIPASWPRYRPHEKKDGATA